MRTLGVSRANENAPFDLDNTVLDGLEALRQRIVQAIKWRIRTWFLLRTRGVDYQLLIGHQTTAALAASTISSVIREEGGAEVTGLRDVQFSLNHETRVFRYSVNVDSIYGTMRLNEDLT